MPISSMPAPAIESARSPNVRWDVSPVLLLVTGAAVIFRLWVLPLGNSFWLDETVVANLIRNNFQEMVYKAFVGAQPVVFSAVEWLIRHFGESEIVLRLPSVFASVCSLIVLYRLGIEAMDREAGLILAAIHVTLIPVAAQAVNARPYAIALFFEYLSILWLLRWVRQGQFKHALMWIASAVFATYFHHLFLTALGVEFAFALILAFRGQVIRFRDLAWCGIVAIAGVLPAVPQAVLMS